jgi:hypothetical protein
MKPLLLIACSLFFAVGSFAQSGIRGLPPGALIVETGKLPIRKRTLVLWMLNPKRNPNGYKPDDIYTCPDQSRGSYYSGPTRVSLINSATNSVINTLIVKEDEDSFDLPYAIRRGYYYRVDAPTRKGVEAKPTIIWLKDYNGDGKAFEFALFEAEACMGLQTTLIGYSEKQDRVIQYPVSLEVTKARNIQTGSRRGPITFSAKSQAALVIGNMKLTTAAVRVRWTSGKCDTTQTRNGLKES